MEFEVDLCYRRTSDNLERLATALATLDLTLRGAPPALKFRLDALDLLGYLEPVGAFDELLPRTDVVSIGGRPTRVIGLDDLIRIKRLREQEGLR